jgi:cell division protein FtsB
MSNMIPIKLAEQAMAVLEAENALLKAEVERLDKENETR